MTHKDIYTKFMIEYDKADITSSYPSLTEYEIATLLDKAYLALLAQKLTGNNSRQVAFEGDNKAIEDVRPLIKTIGISKSTTQDALNATNEVDFEVPNDMLYYVNSNVDLQDDIQSIDNKAHNTSNVNLVTHEIAQGFMNTATNLQSNYDKAISVCYNRKIELEKEGLTLDKTNTTICGLAGLMGSIVNMSAMMLNTSGGGGNLLELSETGFENFTKDEIDATLAAQSLGSYVKQKDDFLMMLNNGLTIGEDGIDAIGSLMGQNDFGNVLGDLTSQLRDSSGNITEKSLLNYLTTSLGLPSIPIP